MFVLAPSRRRTPSCPVPSKPSPSPPPSRSVDRSGERGGRPGGGPRKKFLPKVADNPLISLVSLRKMEGSGSNFRPFLSSRTRPGRAHDVSWNSRGARPEAKAAYSPDVSLGPPEDAVDRPGDGAAKGTWPPRPSNETPRELQKMVPNALKAFARLQTARASAAAGGERDGRSNCGAPHRIGGAYCRPPLFHSAFRPRLILIGEPMPTLRSNDSP